MPKETIVLGVHDLIAPQGRVTVELRDPMTGRVKKRWREDNAITDWYLSQLGVDARMYTRLPAYNTVAMYHHQALAPNLNPFNGTTFNSARPKWQPYRPGKYPGQMTYPSQMDYLWMSDSEVTPDSTHTHIPGNDSDGQVSAWSKTGVEQAVNATESPRRGFLDVSASTETATVITAVFEFPTSVANGTHRSLGFGNLARRNSSATVGDLIIPNGMMYHQIVAQGSTAETQLVRQGTYGFMEAPPTFPTTIECMSFVNNDEVWYTNTASAVLNRWNMETDNIAQIAIASGGTSGATYVSVDKITNDLWLGHAKTLRRCVKPTDNVTLTVTNSYDISGTFDDAAIIGMDNDGTHLYVLGATKIFKYLMSDGSHVAEAAHSGSGTSFTGIMYDPAMGFLWLTAVAAQVAQTYRVWGVVGTGASTSQPRPDSYMRAFGTDLVEKTNYKLAHGHVVSTFGNNNSHGTTGVTHTGMTPDGWVYFMPSPQFNTTTYHAFPRGPSMISHAKLASDVVKTVADVMVVTYEWTYS